MSLSPIFSIIKDFLIVVCGAGSGWLGAKLWDMCKDLFGTFLFSDVEVIFLQDIDGEFPLLVEEADANVLVGVVVGFELLGVENWDALGLDVDSIDFFFFFVALLSLFTGVTCPNYKVKNRIMGNQIAKFYGVLIII